MKNQVNLSDKVFSVIEKRVKESNEFSSVDEYVEFIIKEVLEIKEEEYLTKEEEEKIERHLKDMGYI